MGIQWELSNKTNKNLCDVSFYVSTKDHQSNLSIKKEVWKKMGMPDRVMCGIDSDSGRIYFKDDKRGFSVGRSGSKTRVYFKMGLPHPEYAGDYDVHYDPKLEMYYIGLKDKK